MKIQKIVYLFILLSVEESLYSQFDHIKALQKYWNYRYALKGDDIDPSYRLWEPGFVEVGQGNGYSIPASYRLRKKSNNDLRYNDIMDDDYNYSVLGISANLIGEKYGIMHFGDSPTDLGQYIGVLATEFELLRRNENDGTNYNKNIDNTLRELYYALSAVDRLDINDYIAYGQSFHWGDGFFMRNDVPYDFAFDGKFGNAQSKDPNFKNNPNRGNSFYITQSSWQDINVNKKPKNCDDNGILFGKGNNAHHSIGDPQSVDQLIKVLIGFVLVRKFVNGNYVFHPNPNNLSVTMTANDLNKQAYDFIDRAIWYLKIHCFNYYHQGTSDYVCKGYMAMWYRNPLTGIYDKWASGDSYPSLFNCFNYLPTSVAWGPQLDFYENAVYQPNTLITLPFDLNYLLDYTSLLVSILIYNKTPGFTHEMAAMLMTLNGETRMGGNLAGDLGTKLYLDHFTDLEYQNDAYLKDMKNIIYDGVFAPPTAPSYLENFLSNNNFECEHETRNFERFSDGNIRERNGLNYMLAYNIYCIQNKGYYEFLDIATNTIAKLPQMYDRTISGSFPRTKSVSTPNGNITYTYGTKNSPAIIQASNSIKILKNTTFLPTSKVSLYAPHFIFDPGFNAANFGNVLDIVPKRMSCDKSSVIVGYNVINNSPSQIPTALKKPSVIPNKEKSIEKEISEKFELLNPNPSNTNTDLLLTNYENTNITIVINDMLGKQLYKTFQLIESKEKRISLPTSEYNSGTYIVEIINGDMSKTLKLQIVK